MNKRDLFVFIFIFLMNIYVFSQDDEYEIYKLIDYNNIKEMKMRILSKDTNINFKNKYGETILIYAIKTNASNEIIKFLINNGSDINAVTNEINIDVYSFKKGIDNKTPFIWAILNNNLEIAEILLKRGVDINFSPRNDTTPLIEACRRSDITNVETVNFLIKNGADVNAKIKHTLDFMNNEKLVEELNLKYNIPKRIIRSAEYIQPYLYFSENNETALIISITHTYPKKDIIELLIKNGADVNIKPHSGRSALMEAIIFGHNDIAILLINSGADVNVKTYGKFKRTYLADYTPLIFATHDSMYEVAELLIKKGADINAQATDGITALVRAVHSDQIRMVELLLKNGADVTTRKDNKNILLYYAKQKENFDYDRMKKKKNYKEITKLLKKYGAKE